MASECGGVTHEQGESTNFALVFHDSEIGSVDLSGDTLVVSFSAAAVHSKSDSSGHITAAGYVQGLKMVFTQAEWVGVLGECVGRLSHSVLRISGESLTFIPLPYRATGTIAAELAFNNGAVLSVAASAVVCRFTGEARFLESYAC